MNEVVKEVLGWLLELAKIGIPAYVTIRTYQKMMDAQNPKLDNIEKATNGNLEKKDEHIAELKQHVRALGGTPE